MAATQTTPVPSTPSSSTAILPSFTFGNIPDPTTCSSALISWTYNPGSLPGTSSGGTTNDTGTIDLFLFNDVDPTSTTTLFPREALVKGLSLDTTSWTWNPVAVPALQYRLTAFVNDGTTSTLANSPVFTVNAGSDLSCLSSSSNTSEPSASSSPATIIGAVSKHSALPTSAIVGIVIGILFLLAILASIPILLRLSRKSRKGGSFFFGPAALGNVHGHGHGHSGTGGTTSSASSVHYVRKHRSINSLGSEATLVMDHHQQRGRKASTGSLNKLAYAYGYYDKGAGGGGGETGSRISGDSWAHQSLHYTPSPVSEHNVPGYPPAALPYEYRSRNGSVEAGSVGGHSYVSHGTQLSFTTQATQGTQPPPPPLAPIVTQTGQGQGQQQAGQQTPTRQPRKPVPALAAADADELERASLRSATASQRSARGGGESQGGGYAFGEKPMHYLIPDMPPSGRG